MSQEETELRARMVADAKKLGYWSRSVNDRFVSGYPDMRFSKKPLGQLDVELKILDCAQSTVQKGAEVKSGLTKLQQIELRDMNEAGAPAVGLVLIKPLGLFTLWNHKRIDIDKALDFHIPYTPYPKKDPCVNFDDLFNLAFKYLWRLKNG